MGEPPAMNMMMDKRTVSAKRMWTQKNGRVAKKAKVRRASMSSISKSIENIAPKSVPRLAKKLRAKGVKPEIPVNPIAELREIVRQHKFLMNFATRTAAPVKDRKIKETGEVLPTRAPPSLILDALAAAETAKKEANRLETRMLKLMRGIPIYDEFLSQVDGCGAVVAAYIVSMVRIERANNVSQLIRYCGFGTGADGKSERRLTGPKWQPDGTFDPNAGGTPNQELKIRLVQMFCLGMRMNCVRKGENGQPSVQIKENKYVKRWLEAKHSALTIPNPRLGRLMGDGEADAKGRRKATDLFLWDLYVMWRTLEGLTIRPDKYSAIRGHYHNGQEARDTLYTLTLDEARAMVGLPVAQENAAQ